ncbi:MAG TPA: hypothetical protein VFH95_01535 [Candidatus Kapabacteria bacterium]|nr:hypothetical protein [Candidatus Kapabacteria bacterium]
MNFIGLAHPFLSLPAIELAATLPLAERRRDAAHKYIVHSSFPGLERFWMDNAGFVTPYRGFSELRYAAMAIEHGLKVAGRIVPSLGRLTLRRPTMDMDHLLRPELARVKEILFAPHPRFDLLADRAAIERALRAFEAGRLEMGTAIAQLLTLRLFLDLFF